MFDTMKIAKRIREARIAQNMTQLALADAMEVSYQAVSNWERGNSLPDISKLEQLCQVLHLSLDDLLGTDNKAAAAVTRVLKEEKPSLTMEELREVAPMLPPDEVQKQAEAATERSENIDFSALSMLAPFLDEAYLDELMDGVSGENVENLAAIAPFLSEKTLNKLVEKLLPKGLSEIAPVAPFLSQEALHTLVEKVAPKQLSEIVVLAPFLSKESLDSLVRRALDAGDTSGLLSLAPFLSKETLNAIAEQKLASGDVDKSLIALCPFLSRETVRSIADRLMKNQKWSSLQNIAPFL